MRLLVPALALLFAVTSGSEAPGQVPGIKPPPKPKLPVGKKSGGKGLRGPVYGKKSRTTGKLTGANSNGGTVGGGTKAAASVFSIQLGDRVTGATGAGVTDVVTFDAAAGTKITIRITPGDRSTTLAATLRDAAGKGSLLLKPSRRDPATLELRDHELMKSATYRIDIGFAGTERGEYHVETSAEIPTRLDQKLHLTGGRPHELLIPGVGGRTLQELKVRVVGRDPLRIAARIVDPDGLELPIADYLWTSDDEATLKLSRVPMHRLGDYRLYLVDKSRPSGTIRVVGRFVNPKPGKRHHDGR